MSTPTCSSLARAAHEPPAGTASQAIGYLVIEQPGSWGREAVASRLAPDLAERLTREAKAAGVKVLLARRPGPHPAEERDLVTVLLAHSGPRPWLERCVLSTPELERLDPAVCAEPTPPGRGAPVAEPRWLVCTHAKRDRCCATLGRPIADTLAAIDPEGTWETSHLGGHRFAGTMLVLPHGLLYGNLDVAAAMRVVEAQRASAVVTDHLRGRSRLPKVAQVAEVAVRSALDLDGLDEVEVTDLPTTAPHPDGPAVQVGLTAAGRQVQVRVTARRETTPRAISCEGTPELLTVLEAAGVELVD
ncbi:MAG: sucrase ferredoxin [Nitriliruptoraceae bacterium]